MSDSKELRVGKVVRLNSGGPLMTIEAFTDTDDGRKAYCVWFSVKGGLEPRSTNDVIPIYGMDPSRGCVPVDTLTRIEPDVAG